MTGDALVYATAVAWHGRAVLLRGASGSGKSALALALMTQGWMLVGDDYVELVPSGTSLKVKPAWNLRGWLEVRGQGIIAQPYLPEAQLAFVADLQQTVQRLPESQKINLCGISLPHMTLVAHSGNLVSEIIQALINS